MHHLNLGPHGMQAFLEVQAHLLSFGCSAEAQQFGCELTDYPPPVWPPFTLLWTEDGKTQAALEPVASKCPRDAVLTATQLCTAFVRNRTWGTHRMCGRCVSSATLPCLPEIFL